MFPEEGWRPIVARCAGAGHWRVGGAGTARVGGLPISLASGTLQREIGALKGANLDGYALA
jgi:hypothetical protein